jgi:glyoxylase-like metal-dependent hydrolase (beta-lactamase superfamily II)
VVVQGRTGVLLIDPGITGDEVSCLANDLNELGQPVVTGFSTHPDWDHVLWHAELGEAPVRDQISVLLSSISRSARRRLDTAVP